jgi:hypothetical protein
MWAGSPSQYGLGGHRPRCRCGRCHVAGTSATPRASRGCHRCIGGGADYGARTLAAPSYVADQCTSCESRYRTPRLFQSRTGNVVPSHPFHSDCRDFLTRPSWCCFAAVQIAHVYPYGWLKSGYLLFWPRGTQSRVWKGEPAAPRQHRLCSNICLQQPCARHASIFTSWACCRYNGRVIFETYFTVCLE